MRIKSSNQVIQRGFFLNWCHSFDARWPKIFKILEGYKRGILIDVGCGDGLYSEYLLKRGWKCCGIAHFAEEALKAKKRGVNVLIADINFGFPIRSNCCEVVLAGEIIEHTTNDNFFLQECARILAKEGRLILINRLFGSIGEYLGKYFPSLGEHIIIEASKG